MHIDWPSLALGLGAGALLVEIVTRFLFGEAWAAYRQRQQDQRDAWQREQEYQAAERVAGMVANIIQTKSAPEPDDPHPIKTAASVEELYFDLLKQHDQDAARLERMRHLMNYKNGK